MASYRDTTPTLSMITDSNGNTDPEAVLATVNVTVVNTGPVAGDEVLLLYIKPPSDAVALGAPTRQLAAFQRVSLRAGTSVTQRFDIKQAHVWSILPQQGRASLAALGDWHVFTNTDEDKGLRFAVSPGD
jgi:hypothetical protein